MEQFINLKMLNLNDNKSIVAEKTYHIKNEDEKNFKIGLCTAIASSKVMQHYAKVDTSKRPIRLKMIKTLMEEKESGELVEIETNHKNLNYTNEKGFEIIA